LWGKLVHFPLNPLQSSRDPLVTKSALRVVEGHLIAPRPGCRGAKLLCPMTDVRHGLTTIQTGPNEATVPYSGAEGYASRHSTRGKFRVLSPLAFLTFQVSATLMGFFVLLAEILGEFSRATGHLYALDAKHSSLCATVSSFCDRGIHLP
jgi:hypothetical protein